MGKIFFKIGRGDDGCTVINCGGNSFREFGDFRFDFLGCIDVWKRERGEVIEEGWNLYDRIQVLCHLERRHLLRRIFWERSCLVLRGRGGLRQRCSWKLR